MIQQLVARMFTSPARAAAKYCDEHVCLYVCLSVCPRGYLRNHTRDLYQIFLCMLPMAVARSSAPRQDDEIPRGRGSFGGFPPH